MAPDERKIGREWLYSSRRSGSSRRTLPLTSKALPWNSLFQAIGLSSRHSETTLVTGMYCLIVSGFTNAFQTFSLGALIVSDTRATNVSPIARRTGRPRAATGSCWHDGHIDTARVDVWLWAVRIYKTRSAATAACRGGHVRVNRATAKASTLVKVGSRVEAFVERPRILEVAVVIDKRIGASVAATCLVDHSPPVPKRPPRVAVRERGTGRPTKRERRDLDRLRRR